MNKIFLLLILGILLFQVNFISGALQESAHGVSLGSSTTNTALDGIAINTSTGLIRLINVTKQTGMGATGLALCTASGCTAGTVMTNISFTGNTASFNDTTYLQPLTTYYLATTGENVEKRFNNAGVSFPYNYGNVVYWEYGFSNGAIETNVIRNWVSLWAENETFLTYTDLVTPTNNTFTISSPQAFNISSSAYFFPSSFALNLTNVTFFLWNSSGQLVNQTTSSLSGSSATSTTFNTPIPNVGSYLWNGRTCGGNATRTTCSYGATNYTITYGFNVTATNYTIGAYETNTETFLMNFTKASTISSASSIFYYNNTAYTPTTTCNGNDCVVSRNLDIPLTNLASDSRSLFWQINLNNGTNNFYFNTSSNTQTVTAINLTLCGAAPYNIPYINFTFKNETSSLQDVGAIINADWHYWLGTGEVNKSLSYINTVENMSYAFCFAPQNKTLNTRVSMTYSNAESQQRTYSQTALSLTNSTLDELLYLLPNSEGIFVTFQVINIAEQPISGVFVNATREISGSTVIIASGTTDSAGAITFWLNPNYLHNFNFVKEGFTTFTTSLTPTQSQYTITLGGGGTPVQNLNQGIGIAITPSGDFLDRNTTYNFTYAITSDYWSLDSFGYSLFYGNGSLIESQSSTTSTGGTLSSLNIQMSNTSAISLNYYYVINSTVQNGTRVWIVQPVEGRDFSIWNFFYDLSRYIDTGNFFGFDAFGKSLLAVVILVLTTGLLSARYGIGSESAIMGMIFGIVFFLDVGIGFIPSTITVGDFTSVEHFITFIAFIILFSIVIREEVR